MTEEAYFRFEWPPVAKSVYVTGSFDNWSSPIQLTRSNESDSFEIILKVPKEKTTFKFIVDDVWLTNPDMKIETDESGNQNNVLYPEDTADSNDAYGPTVTSTTSASATEATVAETLNSEIEVETEAETETETEGETEPSRMQVHYSKSDSESHSFFTVSHGDFSPTFDKLGETNNLEHHNLNEFYLDDGDDEPINILNEKDSEGDDEISDYDDDEMVSSSAQVTISGVDAASSSNQVASFVASNEGARQIRYDSNMSLLTRFTRYFK